MKTRNLFFPFTHMAQEQREAVTTFFQTVDVLFVSRDLSDNPVMATLHEDGKINPLFPRFNELAHVDQASAQYLAWADMHKGNETNLKALLKDTPYFVSDTDVTQIKNQLRGGPADQVAEPRSISWENTLLFLRMAQMHDAQNDRIDMELNDLEKTQNELFSALRGLENPLPEPGDKNKVVNDPGDRMTAERIEAWTGYMGYLGELNKSEEQQIFITTSPSVYAYLETNCQDCMNLLDMDQIKVHENKCIHQKEWQDHFIQCIMLAIQERECWENDLPKVDDTCSLSARFKLGLFSGPKMKQFFKMSNEQVAVCLVKLK